MDDETVGGFGRADWLKAVGGVLFFAAGLLPWWELEFADGVPVEFNAFDYDVTGIVPYAIFVGIAVLTIIIKTESLRLPRVLVHPVLSLLAALGATALVGIRFFKDGWDNALLEAEQNTITRGVGLYVAAFAAVVVLAGCVLALRRQAVEEYEDELDEDLDVEEFEEVESLAAEELEVEETTTADELSTSNADQPPSRPPVT